MVSLKSYYAFEYTHYNSSQKIKSSLLVLIDSLQSHLSKDVLLSRNFDEFTKYEQIQ